MLVGYPLAVAEFVMVVAEVGDWRPCLMLGHTYGRWQFVDVMKFDLTSMADVWTI